MKGSKGHTAEYAEREDWTAEELEKLAADGNIHAKQRYFFIRGAEYDAVRGDNAREVRQEEFYRHAFVQGGLSGAD